MSGNQVVNHIILDGILHSYWITRIRRAYDRGDRFGEVIITEAEVSPEFLELLQVIASNPITKLTLVRLYFSNDNPDLVERFGDIINSWNLEEIAFNSSRINDSWYRAIARGLVNKPNRRIEFHFLPGAPDVDLYGFDLPRVHIQSMAFVRCRVIATQPLRHMRCQRLSLNRVNELTIANIRGLIERADPGFELVLETEGVSRTLNELLALNRISELRLKNPILTEDILNHLAEGIKTCRTLTILSFSGYRTERLCRMLWRFFDKIKFHRNLEEINFRCDHGGMCSDRMNTKLQEIKEGNIPLVELMMINHHLHLIGQQPRLPSEMFRHILRFLVPSNTSQPDLPDH